MAYMVIRSFLVGVFGLVAVAGCASTEKPIAVDPSTDPAWIPPDQAVLLVEDKVVVAKTKPRPRARHLQEPNHRQTESVLQARATRPRS